MSTTHVVSTAYVDYSRLLRQLHTLIRRGADESEEGEALREAMDEPCRRIPDLELARVRGLGADLNAIGSEISAGESFTHLDFFNKRFQLAQDEADWDKALDLLRSNPSRFSPARLLFLKGIFWARLEDYETALDFFEEAIHRGPAERQFVIALLQTLFVLGRPSEAIDRILRISETEPDLVPQSLIEMASADRADREVMDALKTMPEDFSEKWIEAEPANLEMISDLFRPPNPLKTNP